MQVILLPTIICPYFLYYTDGLSLFFSITSIVFALLSNRGNNWYFVLMSAVYTLLAVGVRQTNIILAVLNPALIILLRVFLAPKINV